MDFTENITAFTDIEFYIGLPKELSYRMARMHFFTTAELLISSLAVPRKFILFAKMMFSPSSMLGKSIKTMDFSVSLCVCYFEEYSFSFVLIYIAVDRNTK